MPRLTIFPKTHYVTPRETLLAACDLIKEELECSSKYLRKLINSLKLKDLNRELYLI